MSPLVLEPRTPRAWATCARKSDALTENANPPRLVLGHVKRCTVLRMTFEDKQRQTSTCISVKFNEKLVNNLEITAFEQLHVKSCVHV